MTVLLLNHIDTHKKIEVILNALQNKGFLRQKITEAEITKFLAALKHWRSIQSTAHRDWRLNHIEGSVDTPREIEILLDMLRKSKMLSGPIDTPEEVKLFMNQLQQQGFLQVSFANARQGIKGVLDQHNKNRPLSKP